MYPYKGFDPRTLYRDSSSYNRSLKILEKKNLISKTSENHFSLTLQGKIEILKSTKRKFYFNEKKWDKKWRILAFDIPEKNRRTRRQLRELLYVMGFKAVQKSIWITPFNIKFSELKQLFDVRLEEKLLFFVTNQITEEKKVKKIFNIK